MRFVTPSGRATWLGYGMNVHPGGDADAIEHAVDETVVPLLARLGARGPFGVALRLDRRGAEELARDARRRERLRRTLATHELVPFTVNAFVAGAFQEAGVKAAVYRPPWGDPARTRYTLDVARAMAFLAGRGADVSISTAPLAWRADADGPALHLAAARALAEVGRALVLLEEETGARVRVGLEPEPLCAIETTGEAVAFARGPLREALAGDEEAAARLGVCYDVCHQAVEWEDPVEGLEALETAGVPVVKLQASCALEVSDPASPAARAALARFDEPRWLHQVIEAGTAPGRPLRRDKDLPDALARPVAGGGGAPASVPPWRVHFHVPVHRAEAVPPLSTTRPSLERALRHVVARGTTSHVEVETYTWDALPAGARAPTLVESLARELEWVASVLESAGARRAS